MRRAKKKSNMVNDAWIKACLARFDRGSYSRLQFLHAVSHSVGAHTDSLQPRADSNDSDDDVVDLTNAGPATLPASSTPTSSAAAAAAAPDDCCEVCLVEPLHGFALVPCGHARFCESCAKRVAELAAGCPVCRTAITMVMRVFVCSARITGGGLRGLAP